MSHLKDYPEWFKQWQRKFYNSARWKKLREVIRKRDKMICQLCHKFIRGKSICDHIIEVTPDNYMDDDIVYNADNLMMTCIECHNAKTFGGSNNFDLNKRDDVNLF